MCLMVIFSIINHYIAVVAAVAVEPHVCLCVKQNAVIVFIVYDKIWQILTKSAFCTEIRGACTSLVAEIIQERGVTNKSLVRLL